MKAPEPEVDKDGRITQDSWQKITRWGHYNSAIFNAVAPSAGKIGELPYARMLAAVLLAENQRLTDLLTRLVAIGPRVYRTQDGKLWRYDAPTDLLEVTELAVPSLNDVKLCDAKIR